MAPLPLLLTGRMKRSYSLAPSAHCKEVGGGGGGCWLRYRWWLLRNRPHEAVVQRSTLRPLQGGGGRRRGLLATLFPADGSVTGCMKRSYSLA